MKIKIFGAGSDLGVHVNGASLAPEEIINELNLSKKDYCILNQDKNIIKSIDKLDLRKNEKEINDFNKKLYNLILENKNIFPITIGGDHSIAIASALASSKKDNNIGIIWIDAHTDYNTFESTITGNIHGLPLAAITGYKCNELRKFHKGPTINPKNCVIVGARSIDKEEYNNLKDAGVTIFTTNDIKLHGVKEIMNKAFEIALKNTNKTHISYDLDIIDPIQAPGVSVPEIDGISEKEAIEITNELTNNINKVISFDLVEFNPKKDINNKTKKISLKILNRIINTLKNN